IVASIDPIDPDTLKARGGVLHAIRATGTFDAVGDGVSFLQRYLHDSPLHLDGGEGPLHAEVKVDCGTFLAGTHAEVESHEIRARIPDYTIRGSGLLHWRVQDAGSRPDMGTEATLVLDLDDFSLQADEFKKPHVQGSGLSVRAT